MSKLGLANLGWAYLDNYKPKVSLGLLHISLILENVFLTSIAEVQEDKQISDVS